MQTKVAHNHIKIYALVIVYCSFYGYIYMLCQCQIATLTTLATPNVTCITFYNTLRLENVCFLIIKK